MPIPLSRTEMTHSRPPGRRDAYLGDLLAAILDRIFEQVLKHLGQQACVRLESRERIVRDLDAGVFHGRPQIAQDLLENEVGVAAL